MIDDLNCIEITNQVFQSKQWLDELNKTISDGKISEAEDLIHTYERDKNDNILYIRVREKFAKDHNLAYVGFFHDGYAKAIDHNYPGEFFIDRNGKILGDQKYIKVGVFSDGLAKVKQKDSKWNYVNTQGELICPAGYDEVFDFEASLAKVQIGKDTYYPKPGQEVTQKVIDKQGREITKERYHAIGHFHDGYATVYSNFGHNFIDRKGNLLSQEWFTTVDSFSDGLAPVYIGKNNYYINTKGEKIFDIECDWHEYFADGFARIQKEGKYFFIDREGKRLGEEEFDRAYWYQDNRTIVWKKIPDEVDQVYDVFVMDNLGQQRLIGRYGKIIRRLGKNILEVKNDNRTLFINYEGEVIVESPIIRSDKESQVDFLKRLQFYYFSEHLIKYGNEGRYGLFDLKGKELYSNLTEIEPIIEGIAKMIDKNGKKIYIDAKGKKHFNS